MISVKDIITETLGFPSVKRFQGAWNLGPALKVDGIIGDKTRKAAQKSYDRHHDGLPDISEHFATWELRCKCKGKYNGCSNLLVYRGLLVSLEKLRDEYYPIGLTIVSGYRCPIQNRKVGGASGSMHMKGMAADIPGVVRYDLLKIHKWFSGYGVASGGAVVHVDRRDLCMDGVSVQNPTHWHY